MPHELLGRLAFTERVLCRFRRHPQMTITHSWQDATGADETWRAWREGVSVLPSHVVDLPMVWLPPSLSSGGGGEDGQAALVATAAATPLPDKPENDHRVSYSVVVTATSASSIRVSWRFGTC